MSHKKRNWSDYNKSLINRGDITFWIDEEVAKCWFAEKTDKQGRPFVFSNKAIEILMHLKYVFTLPYRQLEGFSRSLFKILNLEIYTPYFSQIAKRMKKLDLSPHLIKQTDSITTKRDRAIAVIVDATGVQVCGKGEWMKKKHGVSKVKRWKKLHLAINAKNGEFVFSEITDEIVDDKKFLPQILKNEKNLKMVLMDGAADTSDTYKMMWKAGIKLLTPPNKRAIIRKEPWMASRNKLIQLQKLCQKCSSMPKKRWGQFTRYNKRMAVESAIARWKRIFGEHLEGQKNAAISVEIKLKSMVLNKMRMIGPKLQPNKLIAV